MATRSISFSPEMETACGSFAASCSKISSAPPAVCARKIPVLIMATTIFLAIIMVLLSLVFFKDTGYVVTLIELGVSGALSIGAYLFVTYRLGIIDWLFGKDMPDKVLTRLHLKR